MLPSTMHTARLALIVEDQSDTRAWLSQMLTGAFDGIAVTETGTLRAARDWIAANVAALAAATEAPPIALVDIGLPDGSGIDLIRELTRKHRTVICIVTTIYDDDHHLFDAIAAGAQGYLLKDQHPDTLIQYLHRIERGEPPLSPSIAQRMLQHFSRLQPLIAAPGEPSGDALTAREMDVLRLLGRGLRVSEAARVLGLTPHTVAGYVKNVYRKLNISSRAEATIEALRRGLV
ncbi:MAG TPA: response regulator transcription factor [Pseudolabrys sp.]|nr:response regulator transcription factor [Pseudolabrys sp.]